MKQIEQEPKNVKQLLDELLEKLTPEFEEIRGKNSICSLIDETTEGLINEIIKKLLTSIDPVQTELNNDTFIKFIDELNELNLIVSVAENDISLKTSNNQVNRLDLYYLVALQFSSHELAKKLVEFGANSNCKMVQNYLLLKPQENNIISESLDTPMNDNKEDPSDILPGGKNYDPKDEE